MHALRKPKEKAEKSSQADAPSAHDGIVELHLVLKDTSVWHDALVKRRQMLAIIAGYFCGKYGEELAQGISIHENFKIADGHSVGDFTVNKHSCGMKDDK